MNKTLIAAAMTSTFTLVAAPSYAAGFQLNSQSATGIGRAFAGDAIIADNASVLSRNPAAMALFDQKAVSVGASYVDLDVQINNVEYAGGNLGSIDDAASNTVIPNFYYIQPLSDKWAFGIAAFTNFGTGTDSSSLLSTQAPVNPIPGGAMPLDLIGETEVITMNLNASVSYRINDQFAIGAGLDIVHGSGKLTRAQNAISADADGIGFGGILGATYEVNDNHRFGMSYRFSPNVTATGDIGANLGINGELSYSHSVVGSGWVPNSYTVNLNATDLALGIAADFEELEVPLPDVFQFAGFHQLTDRFALHYTAQWTQWSVFDQVTARNGKISGDFAGTLNANCQGDSAAGEATCLGINAIFDQILPISGERQLFSADLAEVALKEYNWKDSWMLSIGGTYDVTDKLALRAGYMYDQGVVGEIASLSIPDSDRNWYTAGMGYKLSRNASVDLGIAFVRGKEVQLEEDSLFAGTVSATTNSNAVYYSMQYNHRF
ncbi:TonB-dependent receptor [Ferrimonas pelagia]|uniref:TonB-dependent receptor n=2 Tax=Ferrimonas pelagia TaxID=1177826 RepID=A0ABP9EAZ9_9GAMM